MSLLKVIVLAFVQGLAELLPVSSSAHVIVAEKLMGLDPSSPQMTLLLVMLHTGTMFSVIVFFWNIWRTVYFSSTHAFKQFAVRIVCATVLTGAVGEAVKKIVERTLFRRLPTAEIEQLFGHLELIAPALAAVGILILLAGFRELQTINSSNVTETGETISFSQAGWMGAIQGLALLFRGFSRSGATISAGMLFGAKKETAERFSFAMAVVLTPAIIGLESLRLHKAWQASLLVGAPIELKGTVAYSLVGMFFSFVAGLCALKWLSVWLESGRWYLFGIYCLLASALVFYLHLRGF